MRSPTSCTRSPSRRTTLAIVLAAIGLAGAAAIIASLIAERQPAPPLIFGIYPGGPVGTVRQRAEPPLPDDPGKQMLALAQLRGTDRRFVLRVYIPYVGDAPTATLDQATRAALRRYSAAGFDLEVVLTYRPKAPNSRQAVAGYVSFVREAVRQLGPDRHVVSFQITNEVNVQGTFDAADGSYAGARDALVAGVIAAKDEARRQDFRQLRVGFSWAYSEESSAEGFWRDLGARGGQAFATALDWVGLNIYPGTWGPPLTTPNASGVREQIVKALRALRRVHLAEAGIPQSVALHVTENGYPTGRGRTYSAQASVTQTAIRAVNDVRGEFGVTQYCWFSLRDANSSDAHFESEYGLMRDDYTPKPAFVVYRSLIAELSRTAAR